MPQLIDVPGMGVVEFPDDMDDAAIVEAIRRNSGAADTAPRTASPGFGTALAQALGLAPEETQEAALRRSEREQYDAGTSTLGRLGTDFKRGTMRAGQSLVGAFSDLALELGMAQPAVQNTMAEQGLTPDQVRAAQPAVVARDVAGIEQQIRALPTRPIVGQVGAASTMGEAIGTLLEDPSGFIAGVGAESAGTNLPALLAALGTGPVGGAALIGGSSYLNERQGGILQKLAERGVDTADPVALAAALNDPALLQEAVDYGEDRAEVIGPIDAATAGLGSKLLVPKVLQGPLGRVGTEVANVPAQMTVQAGAGAAGEAGAQIRTDGEVTAPGDVLAEAVGEGFTAPLDVASVGRTAIQERLRTKQDTAAVPSPAAAATPADAGAAPEAPTAPAPAAPAAPAKVLQGPLGTVAPPIPPSAPQAPAESVQTTLPAQDALGAGSDAPAPAPAAATSQPPLPETPDAIYQALDEATNLDADLTPGPDPDAARGSDAAVRADRGGVATPGGAGAAPDAGRVGTFAPEQTLERSPFERVFEDAGYTRDEATLLTDGAKIEVLRDAFKRKFGVAPEVDPTLNTQKAVDNMLDLYQNADAMLSVVGLPRTALTFGGKMRLRFYNRNPGNKGMRGAMAFAMGNQKIAVNERHSAFAHEYGHALDYAIQEQILGGLVGRGLSGSIASTKTGGRVRASVESTKTGAAFYALMRSMYRSPDEAIKLRALEHQIEQAREAVAQAKADGKPTRTLQAQLGKLLRQSDAALNVLATGERQGSFFERLPADDYLRRPTEMIARTFEAYISNRIETQLAERGLTGRSAEQATKFLGLPDRTYTDELNEQIAKIYPNPAEREAIFAKFDDLVRAMAEDKMFGAGGNVAPMPLDYGPNDPARWGANKAAAQTRSKFSDEIENVRTMGRELRNLVRNNSSDSSTTHTPSVKRIAQMWVARMGTVMLSIRKKYAENSAVANIVDAFTYRPGEGRVVGQVYERAVNQEMAKFVNRMARINDASNAKNYTEDQWEQVRDLLAIPWNFLVGKAPEGSALQALPANTYTRDFAKVDPSLVKHASELRRLLVDAWYYQERAGIDMGFTRTGYYPRVTRLAAVSDNPDGFRRAATEVYELVRTREIEGEMASIEKALEKLAAYDDTGKKIDDILAIVQDFVTRALQGPLLPMDTRKFSKALGKALRELQPPPGAQFGPEDVRALQQILKAVKALTEAARLDPEIQASGWYHEVMYQDMNDWASDTPGGKFQKPRKLPPETDQIMREFLVTDPVEALPLYFLRAARSAEFVRRFGKGGEKLRDWFKEAAIAGVSPADHEALMDVVKMSLGAPRMLPNAISTPVSWFETITQMALLKLVTVTSIPEIIVPAVRSGSGADAGVALYTWLENMASALKKSVTGKGLERAESIEAFATFLGVVTTANAEMLSQSRYMGETEISGEKLGRLANNYYRNIGIHAITRAHRKAAAVIGWRYLERISADARSDDKKIAAAAKSMLADLGVPEAQVARLADAVRGMGGRPDPMTLQNSPMQDMIQVALNRFVDEAIQNPTRLDKTYLANTNMPLLSGPFRLLGFAYSFANNIILGSFRRGSAISKKAGADRALIYSSGVAFAFALAYMTHVLVTIARESLINPDRWERDFKDENGGIKWESVLALSAFRMGLAGPVDPLFQYYFNLRYESSITAVLLGPVYGSQAMNVDRMSGIAGRNSENTNTAEWNAARGAYDAFGGATLAIIAGSAPGGTLLGAGVGVTNSILGSHNVRNSIIDATVGEKDSRKSDKGQPTQPGMIQ